jgi:uncharacterized protein YxeA
MLKETTEILESKIVLMKNKLLILIILFTLLSCNKTIKVETINSESKNDFLSESKENLKSETKLKTQEWYDGLIVEYIKKSDNKLIKLSFKNNERIEWLLDRTEKTDSTNYFIFNIGHDVSEKDGSEQRFVSEGWIYIDSISKKIYEYDLPNDSLIHWKKKLLPIE